MYPGIATCVKETSANGREKSCNVGYKSLQRISLENRTGNDPRKKDSTNAFFWLSLTGGEKLNSFSYL